MTDQPDITPENVARMLDGVTASPWRAEPHEEEDTAKYFWYVFGHGVIFEVEDPGDDVLATSVGSGNTDRHERNARFIAYAREAVPALAARVAELEAETSALSSWQCPFPDGKTGLTSDDHGHQFCAMQRRAEAAEAALAATCQREAASIVRWEAKLAASEAREERLREALTGLVDRYEEVVTTPDCSCGIDDYDLTKARATLEETKP
jgi:hypothetical protein